MLEIWRRLIQVRCPKYFVWQTKICIYHFFKQYIHILLLNCDSTNSPRNTEVYDTTSLWKCTTEAYTRYHSLCINHYVQFHIDLKLISNAVTVHTSSSTDSWHNRSHSGWHLARKGCCHLISPHSHLQLHGGNDSLPMLVWTIGVMFSKINAIERTSL